MYKSIGALPTVLIEKDGSIKEVDSDERLNYPIESLFQRHVCSVAGDELYRVKVVIISLSDITDSHIDFIVEVGRNTIKKYDASLK